MPSILFVFTSADKNLLGEHTGYFLPEAAHPYYTLAPKFTIYFASPKGPNPPADEDSVKFYQAGKITAAVCHGPAALVGATGKDGKSVFDGKKVAAFSNAEEEILQKTKLEDKIKEKGGLYEKAGQPWEAKVVVDGSLITGQNPNSAAAVGEAIVEILLSPNHYDSPPDYSCIKFWVNQGNVQDL